MIDIRWLRESPDAFDRALSRRGLGAVSRTVLDLDQRRRRVETELQDAQAKRNRLSREIGLRRAKGEDTGSDEAEVGRLKTVIREGEEALRAIGAELEALLPGLPNVLDDSVPDGRDSDANVELRRWGEPRAFAFTPRPHDEVGAALGMDFASAAKLSGARFVLLRGGLARLERAIAAFMLDLQTREHGYLEVSPPLLVRDTALFGTGQLPKFAEDQFRTTSGHWLIPTAEVPLTNLVADEIVDAATLPLRFTAFTACFRSEAGAAGRDTRGMIRQHQFGKVELVSIAHPERSADEHERMTGCAEAVLQRLGLPYRVMLLCAGDTGFASRKTYDLEVWLPGQGSYREISSCSNCGDFQARRMNARMREGEGRPRFVHTLNGSGLAVGRTLIAVLENYQEEDGSVVIPEALRPYMDGLDRLRPHG